ncbi:hypothetical protein SAMN05444156_2741 [Verrucomicrobium sp. GAS474]|uniref:DUF4912 domain-containing protein n=1 Tax=Verrucomicrobium sp. GAS474 TaxID=1882831 RepID=UPI00087A5855|nr:DUF4912 domain-containing protein [Verrucomicrobium sp. GAS474]SDU23051.1 hypothetical protein SAMN05444156_2741 [Verrucomicrobium sp. GAS474]
MAKKTSEGASRRSQARTKSERVAAEKAAPVLRKSPRVAASLRPADPQLSARPVVQSVDPEAYKFVLTPPPMAHHEVPAYEHLGELPESYGTKKVYLVARDPYFLFAYWDLTGDQFRDLAHQASDGKVFLVLLSENGNRVQQIEIGPWAKHWYLHTHNPGATYYAELGFFRDGKFEVVSRSGKTKTPRDTVSPNTKGRFVTLPFHIPFRNLLEMIRAHMNPGEELVETLGRLQEEGFTFPFEVFENEADPGDGVYDYLGDEIHRTHRVGSHDITEVLRRRMEQNRSTSSGQWPIVGPMPSSHTTPLGSSFGAPRNFFMHVNAELIIYGGTDPKAKVRIDGRNIALKEDGTFTFHFNLPDGQFHIPIEAVSPDGVERRSALLSFLRLSEFIGQVDATSQTPRPEPFGRFA